MEAGAQPERGAESPLPKIDPKYPDIAVTLVAEISESPEKVAEEGFAARIRPEDRPAVMAL